MAAPEPDGTAISSGSSNGIATVSVRFVTRYCRPMPVDAAISLPTRLGRYGLSEVVNHLLLDDQNDEHDQEDVTKNAKREKQKHMHVPYDFLIDGELLRTDIAHYLERKGITGEAGLVIEYMRALPEPNSRPPIPHPDWVSGVVGRPSSGLIFTACYDGIVRMYNAIDSQLMASAAGHTSAVKAIAVDDVHVISAAKDQTIRIVEYSADSKTFDTFAVIDTEKSIEAVAILGSKFVTAGFDRKLSVWSFSDAVDAQPTKRRNAQHLLTPRTVIECQHNDAVTCLAFPHPNAVYTGSLDHDLRLFDLTSGSNTERWRTPSAMKSLSFNEDLNLIAAAHVDGIVRLFDPRIGGSEALKTVLRSHKGQVSSVCWNTADHPHLLVSGGFDSTAKLWDARATVPLYTVQEHRAKVLAVGWIDETILTASADSSMSTHTLALSSSPK